MFLKNFLYKRLCTMTSPIIKVREGTLKGAVEKLYDGTKYYSFKGIPYAQPPVGKLRFKAPLPLMPWQGTYDATKHGPMAVQTDLFTREKTGDEDCLYLNVYTKSLQKNSNLPVMVYIHGGAYMSGSGNSDTYGPEFLLQHDVILVTINYRLEVLGFLCLDTPEVPGNAGMKDQVAALKWIQENIKNFGGDPNNITLFGESAGAASVTYHMMSPMSKGLFHKVIAQSGVCIADWAQGKDYKERAFRIAKVLGKEITNTEELLKYLQNVPACDLADMLTFKTSTRDERYRGIPMHFVPVIEKRFNGVEPFLDEDPMDMLISNKIQKVPIILGYNSQEGLALTTSRIKILDVINKNPGYLLTREIANKVSAEKLLELGKRVKEFYVGHRDFNEDDIQVITDIASDESFIYNINRFAHFYSKIHKQIYLYRFNYDTDLNFIKNVLGWSEVEGASHADELFYLFGTIMVKDAYKEQDKLKEIVYKFTKMWADFAWHSDPTPDNALGYKWQPYTENKEILYIDETLSMGRSVEQDRTEFWNKLYCEAGLPYIAKSSL